MLVSEAVQVMAWEDAPDQYSLPLGLVTATVGLVESMVKTASLWSVVHSSADIARGPG